LVAETDQDRNKATVRRLFEEVFQNADINGLDDIVAPDIIDHDPVPDQPAGIEGIRHVIHFLHGAVSAPRFVIEDLIVEDDRVVARWRLSGTSNGTVPNMPPAGTPTDGGIIVIFRMENGKIVERWAAHQR
jgi:predicted ester cyclase